MFRDKTDSKSVAKVSLMLSAIIYESLSRFLKYCWELQWDFRRIAFKVNVSDLDELDVDRIW